MENKKQSFYVCIVTQRVAVALHATENTTELPMLSCAPETRLLHSRKTIPDIDTASLNCNQNKRAFFSSYKSSLLIASTKWRVEEKYCVKAEENG